MSGTGECIHKASRTQAATCIPSWNEIVSSDWFTITSRHPDSPPRAQGYPLLQKACAQIKDDIDESGIDRKELLSCSIQMLMAVAGQAMQQNNPGAVVACICQLDHMTGTGCHSHRTSGVRR